MTSTASMVAMTSKVDNCLCCPLMQRSSAAAAAASDQYKVLHTLFNTSFTTLTKAADLLIGKIPKCSLLAITSLSPQWSTTKYSSEKINQQSFGASNRLCTAFSGVLKTQLMTVMRRWC